MRLLATFLSVFCVIFSANAEQSHKIKCEFASDPVEIETELKKIVSKRTSSWEQTPGVSTVTSSFGVSSTTTYFEFLMNTDAMVLRQIKDINVEKGHFYGIQPMLDNDMELSVTVGDIISNELVNVIQQRWDFSNNHAKRELKNQGGTLSCRVVLD